jgi:Arabinose-binding domain of AraC transcription regulator, N-term
LAFGDRLWAFSDKVLRFHMTAMVRAQSLRGYRELVKDLGGNSTRLIRKAGIEPAALGQLTAFISFESLIDLLELSAADLDCADFGLRLSERQDIGILGVLSVAMRYSATVGEAMRCASRYLHVYNEAIAFTINTQERPRQARLEFGVLATHDPRWAQTAEHGIGLAFRIMTMLSEEQCHLQQVWFSHPAVSPEARYLDRFDAPLTFRANRLALAYATTDLNRPISEHNRQLHDLARSYLESHLPPGPTPFSGSSDFSGVNGRK